MSVDREPREGDEFKWPGGLTGGTKRVVDVVTPRGDVVYYRADGVGPYVVTAVEWRESATLVAPRPKVADCWGFLDADGWPHSASERTARGLVADSPNLTLVHFVGGRICDEHGEPFEAAT